MDIREINNFFGDMDLFLLDYLLKGKISKDSRVLDVGCGGGRNAVYFIQNQFDYTGIDPDESKVRLVRYLANQLTSSKACFLIDRLETFCSDQLFSFIICSRVLHFLSDEDEFLNAVESLSKLLVKNGILYVSMDSIMDCTLEKSIDSPHTRFPDGKTRFALTASRYNIFLDLFEEAEPPRTLIHHGERAQSFLFLRKP